MTFRIKLMISLIALAIIPILIVSWFNFSFSSTEIQKQTRSEARTIVKKLDYELEDLYDDAIFTLSGVSLLDTIKSSVSFSPSKNQVQTMEAFLDKVLSITPIFASYQIVAADGNQVYKTYKDKSINKVYLKNLHDRTYFSEAMRTRKPVISEVIIARATGKPIIIIGQPILSSKGETIGVLSGVIDYDEILSIISAMKISSGAYPFITSNEGLILAHPDKNNIAKKNIFDISIFAPKDSTTIHDTNEGFVSYTYRSSKNFLYFKRCERDKSIIYYSIPRSDFFKIIDKVKLIVIVIVMLASVFSIFLAVFISRKIEQSMDRVKQANIEVFEKNKELNALANKLAKYLSPQLYQSIFTGKKDVKIETYRKKLTVFFSDIKDFSKITDSMQSEALSSLLNEYLNEMSRIAIKYSGTIDKYIGDAMMIFFGDPDTKGEKEDAYNCVAMAIEMRKTMNYLQELWVSKGVSRPLKIRIGINTGFCTIGNFGSEERLDYTIIGGEVNMASRLESNATVDSILISHET